MHIIPEKLQRYIKFTSFLIKYWNSDVVNHAINASDDGMIDDGMIQEPDALHSEAHKDQTQKGYDKPEELVEDLKDMGPTWVKLGQLLSTRPDLLPDEYVKALSSLQDNVQAVPYEEIFPILEEELGVRVSKGFAEFDEKPIASASIGQVHRAVLRSGVEVAVKIQRPDIRKKFTEDIEIIKEVISLAMKYSKTARKYALDDIVEDMHHILLNELDYTREARNLVVLGKNLAEYESIIVPQPIHGYCTSKVLTMEYMKGRKITTLGPLIKAENDFTPLVEDLVECFLKQIIVDGFAHADPHPGNVHLTPANTIALMDLGMVATFSHTVQDKLLKLLIAMSNMDGDGTTDVLLELSDYNKEVNPWQFRKNVNRLVLDNQTYAAKQMQTGKVLIHINRLAAEEGIKIGTEINMVGKILLNLDQIVATLAPEFDLQASIRNHLEKLLRNKMLGELKPENLLNTLVELKNLSKNLPGRINTITKRLADNELEIKINAFDEKRFTDGFQKVANRITLGLIIAAMIIGASMLMSVPSTFTLWGYPGLAMIFFIAAAVAGFYLIYIILFKDEDYKSKT